ncbi:hypothetical protein C9374_009366 [Naegleria lovaniensis]|uniref:cysteine--tRNA ligase n=1 Tax=Naegleria lovaniensis TaxID=51637 RepID=A0AA88KF25_NAELO|nr:uncharacterized protein C9374_009366 [Naegleria lovaniensis]KAG2377455.1 hypothetical protein C9374_009366 [Naegleria lovaniensis]
MFQHYQLRRGFLKFYQDNLCHLYFNNNLTLSTRGFHSTRNSIKFYNTNHIQFVAENSEFSSSSSGLDKKIKWFDPSCNNGNNSERDGTNHHGTVSTPITIYNSLSKTKVPFVIAKRNHNSENSENIKKDSTTTVLSTPPIYWYSCGPTVYDASHLGHARNYVCLDVIYRILTNYFQYQVYYVMGITDVDDKILKRAAELHKKPSEISLKYERDFITDMKRLNVTQPAVYTRVTEHIEEIKLFIEQMERNGFTYLTKNGGIYFDSQKFENSDHVYGKLAPNTNQEESIQQEHIEFRDEKKDPRDFALWKFTSREFMGWESKWGFGRPGWHIECSAMIDSVFRNDTKHNLEDGKFATLDIHSGGIDLAFPHHNNEIAQSEACHHHQFCSSKRTNWCNYFIHVGHLHIHGLKMSKSLKNFITIREYLEKYTADQFRLFCLLHKYNETVDYSQDAIEGAIRYEKRIHDFLHNVAFYRKEHEENIEKGINKSRKWDTDLKEYTLQFMELKQAIHEAICDDFNTPLVMDHISTIINMTNTLFFSKSSKDLLALDLLENTSHYIVGILNMFGLRLGMTARQDFTGETESDEEISKHPFASKIIALLVEFRAQVRKEALNSEPKPTNILHIIDELRDKKLKELGIRIDDRSSEKSMWRYDVTVKSEKEQCLDGMQSEKPQHNEQHQQQLAQRQQEVEFKLTIPLEQYFKQMPQHANKNYSQFNESGIPTHDQEGQPLSKSAIKKLTKELEKHAEFLEKHSQRK